MNCPVCNTPVPSDSCQCGQCGTFLQSLEGVLEENRNAPFYPVRNSHGPQVVSSGLNRRFAPRTVLAIGVIAVCAIFLVALLLFLFMKSDNTVLSSVSDTMQDGKTVEIDVWNEDGIMTTAQVKISSLPDGGANMQSKIITEIITGKSEKVTPIQKEMAKLAAAQWNMTKIGDSFFLCEIVDDVPAEAPFDVPQKGYKRTLELRDIEICVYYKELTEADKLNDLEWQGSVKLMPKSYRSYTKTTQNLGEDSDTWPEWESTSDPNNLTPNLHNFPSFNILKSKGLTEISQPLDLWHPKKPANFKALESSDLPGDSSLSVSSNSEPNAPRVMTAPSEQNPTESRPSQDMNHQQMNANSTFQNANSTDINQPSSSGNATIRLEDTPNPPSSPVPQQSKVKSGAEEAKQLMDAALVNIRKNNVQDGLTQASQALQLDPSNVEANKLLEKYGGSVSVRIYNPMGMNGQWRAKAQVYFFGSNMTQEANLSQGWIVGSWSLDKLDKDQAVFTNVATGAQVEGLYDTWLFLVDKKAI